VVLLQFIKQKNSKELEDFLRYLLYTGVFSLDFWKQTQREKIRQAGGAEGGLGCETVSRQPGDTFDNFGKT